MVDRAAVQAKVAYGLAKVAAELGAACAWYRPRGAGAALAGGNSLGTLQAVITADPAFVKTSRVGKPEDWIGFFDITLAQIGDYLVDPSKPVDPTFFIAAIEDFRPARLVRCNRVLTILRPAPPAPGADYYPGFLGNATTLLTSWPAAVILGARRLQSEVDLPRDGSLLVVDIRLPTTTVQLLNNDVARDDEVATVSYIFNAVEQAAQGNRINATQAGA